MTTRFFAVTDPVQRRLGRFWREQLEHIARNRIDGLYVGFAPPWDPPRRQPIPVEIQGFRFVRLAALDRPPLVVLAVGKAAVQCYEVSPIVYLNLIPALHACFSAEELAFSCKTNAGVLKLFPVLHPEGVRYDIMAAP